MDQSLSQLPLSIRIPTLAQAVHACKDRQQQLAEEEATYMDLLAQAEAAVVGKAPGWEGVELSGLIPPDQNPHIPAATPPSDEQGDTHQHQHQGSHPKDHGAHGPAGRANLPKDNGDPSPAGSESSPSSHSQSRKR